MPTIIRHKLLNIPVSLVNFVNPRAYNSSPLHQFSSCHKARVRYKKVCENCDKRLTSTEIFKGTDAEHILTKEQQDKLKEQMDNQTIEILSFEQKTENFFSEKIPFTLIQKSQLILPSISKGYKKKDINIFLSFKQALKELNAYCKVKYTSRAKQHYGILTPQDNNLIFIELPFYDRLNHEDIARLKEQVNNLNVKPSLKDFAKDYIKSNLKEIDYQTIKDKKAILLKQYLEQALNPDELKEQEKETENPFIQK